MTMKANHPDSVGFENYSEAEGFPVKSAFKFMVDNTGAILTSEGKNSIKRFDYKKVKENSKPFNLHITQIRLNNEVICWSNLNHSGNDSLVLQFEMQFRFGKLLSSGELKQKANQFSGVRYDSIIPFDLIPYNLFLPYKANSISFDFAAIDPHFSKSTRYQFQLEGFDKTWSPLSKNTNANFGNLREGRYTFKLKALNPYGKWSEMSYSFEVLPPWYRTWWAYTLYALLFIIAISIFIRWRTNKLQKEKIVLEEKVTNRTAELKESLENLKSTQSQLIQSEKMASLGELTAGIAHEIQNPLNFVNNFSEVSTELISEMKEEIQKSNYQEVNDIADKIRQNLEKIHHHGKRADAIVKGMLQHSSKGSGKKEPTDINALCEEYLRLAYHGLRAKDKSFNAKMKTDFDQGMGSIQVIPQDIGRVVLNLINNAFYAVDEKAKLSLEGFEPTVTVSTRKVNGRIEIKVGDNGNGVPQKVMDKIFQPFFTTKPTGQGTGLGLSLSYDIVKAHGGDIKVETREGKGTEFFVLLPKL
jgi:signal transduction histidine kinase